MDCKTVMSRTRPHINTPKKRNDQLFHLTSCLKTCRKAISIPVSEENLELKQKGKT